MNENIILIGTAHISKKSVAEVRSAIEKYKPDIVAVELCDKRYSAITKKNQWDNTTVIDVLRSGKGFLLLVQTFLAMIQRKLGREFGVEPGSEMIAAIKTAKKNNLKIALVDRDITITFRRAWRLMTLREKLRLFWYSTKALIGYDRIDEELEHELEAKIDEVKKNKSENAKGKSEKADKLAKEVFLERMMDEDVISAMMEELRTVVPNATRALIDERDQYISKKIYGYVDGSEKRFVKYKKREGVKSLKSRESKESGVESRESSVSELRVQKDKKKKRTKNRVLAVVGAGHLKGIKKNIKHPEKLPSLKRLENTPKKGYSVLKVVGYLIPILFAAMFIYLIYFGEYEKLYDALLAWFIINGICSAIGAAIAFGHPFSIATAFFAAPITSLNPAIGAGWVAGYVEVKVRSPTVQDIRKLSTIETMKDFFSNKVIKVLMVMALANLGSVIGTFLAGWYIGGVVLS